MREMLIFAAGMVTGAGALFWFGAWLFPVPPHIDKELRRMAEDELDRRERES